MESKWPKSQWKSPNGSKDIPVFFIVKTPLTFQPEIFFTVKKLILYFKCRPLGTQHPTGSITLQGSEWPDLGLQWPQAGTQAGTLSALAPHRANIRNLGQSSACVWVRWRVWRQQTATQSLSWAWQCWASNSTWWFLHLKTRSVTTPPSVLRKQTTNNAQ